MKILTRSVLVLGMCVLSALQLVADQTGYRAHIDLLHVVDDKVRVMVFPPKVKSDTVVFVFPTTIPGTYQRQNWWKLVRNFTAVDTGGKYLPIRRTSDSMFIIDRAKSIKAIAYEVNDTFDDSVSSEEIFHPAGTTFEGDSVFLLNHANVLGYYDGHQHLTYHVEVQHPKKVLGISGLALVKISDTLDVYNGESYDMLVDNPVMYTVPDTASFVVAGAKIVVSLAHSGEKKQAKAYAKDLESVCRGIGNFLPRMPVDRYAFLIYLYDQGNDNVILTGPKFGALEHGQSSVYFVYNSRENNGIEHIAAHEFLHVLLPLNLHSEEIESFNFRKPEMSKHLWLYEGVTEYFSHLALLRNGSITDRKFWQEFESKSRGEFVLPKDFSFTVWSKDVLSEKGQEIYPMIYSYGAFHAMLLDIKIRKTTNNALNLLKVVTDLSLSYGKSHPFKDDELIGLIGKATNPEVEEFLHTYIEGTKRAPKKELLNDIGMRFIEADTVQTVAFGINVVSQTENGLLLEPESSNPLGIAKGDVMTHLNGKPLQETRREDWAAVQKPKEGDKISITVLRNGVGTELTGAAKQMATVQRYIIKSNPEATPEQLDLRQQLLVGKK